MTRAIPGLYVTPRMNKRPPHRRRAGALLILEMEPDLKKQVATRAAQLDLTLRQYVTQCLRRELLKQKAA